MLHKVVTGLDFCKDELWPKTDFEVYPDIWV